MDDTGLAQRAFQPAIMTALRHAASAFLCRACQVNSVRTEGFSEIGASGLTKWRRHSSTPRPATLPLERHQRLPEVYRFSTGKDYKG